MALDPTDSLVLVIPQRGTSGYETELWGAASLPDGSFVVTGYVDTASDDYDFIAYKLSADGEYLWEWTVRFYRGPTNATRTGDRKVGVVGQPRQEDYILQCNVVNLER